MELLLVRHGSRSHDPAQSDPELTGHGRHQIHTLARALRLREARIDCYLSSESHQAQETACVLQQELGGARTPVFRLAGLTPDSGPGDVATIIEQALAVVPELSRLSTIVLVGHEGRLSDLVTELTGTRIRPLAHGEVVFVRADSLADCIGGTAELHARYPAFDHLEGPLQSKVQSKMTVSTFLAGFVFTALSGLLLLTPEGWTLEQVIAVVALASSLALFIACVYIYDQLGMPSGFWTDARRPRLWARLYGRAERRREERWHATEDAVGAERADEDVRPWLQDGPRYHLMLRTSRLVFTPATWLALIGFLALIKGTGDLRIGIGAVIGMLIAGGFALSRRPHLGAD